MAKLLKKMRKSTVKEIKSEYYLPKKETIKALSNREHLTKEQVEDYITYIRQNYFVAKINVGLLDQFCAEYTLFACDEARAQKRIAQAKQRVRESLEDGVIPDIADALWISSKIYVDDIDTLKRRIITKAIVDDKMDINVSIARYDMMTAKQVANLKGELYEVATSVKSVENRL